MRRTVATADPQEAEASPRDSSTGVGEHLRGTMPTAISYVRIPPTYRRLGFRRIRPVQCGSPDASVARRRVIGALCAATLAPLLAAAFQPVMEVSPERVFEIPAATWSRRMAGQNLEILPQQVLLTLGVTDVLVLRNLDSVPHIFGPTLLMPGQTLRLPFHVASTYRFECTAHASGQLLITVEPYPNGGWDRLRWRAQRLWRHITWQ